MAHVDFCTLYHYHHILARLQVRTRLRGSWPLGVREPLPITRSFRTDPPRARGTQL